MVSIIFPLEEGSWITHGARAAGNIEDVMLQGCSTHYLSCPRLLPANGLTLQASKGTEQLIHSVRHIESSLPNSMKEFFGGGFGPQGQRYKYKYNKSFWVEFTAAIHQNMTKTSTCVKGIA